MAVVVRAKTVVTNAPDVAQCGVTFDALGTFADGAIVCENDGVAWTGSIEDLPAAYRSAELHEFADCVIVPGFVDAHSHPLFSGDREPDFAARLRGERPPLGMLYTVEQTRNPSIIRFNFGSTSSRGCE